MSLNVVCFEGRIPFDIEVKNEGEANAFLMTRVSVKRNYKPEGEKYYPEDLVPIKAFKKTADFIGNHFEKGKYIGIKGELRVDDDWKDKDGNDRKGELYVNVTDVFFPEGNAKSNSDDADKPAESSKPANKSKSSSKSANKNPLLGGKNKAPWAK